MSDMPVHFVDEYSYSHLIKEKLGRGGQGIVYRTTDPDIALKICIDNMGNPVTNLAEVEELQRKLRLLKRLPLEGDLNIALPSAMLNDYAGYIMPLLGDMVPFSHFFGTKEEINSITKKDIPDWLLPEIPLKLAGELIIYARTGGLRRRLWAFYRAAAILARLHGRGLVYGDISPNNVFFSANPAHRAVWFIDADNLRFAGRGRSVFTPKYGAPELVQGVGFGSSASDCYAFAVMVYYYLTMVHPFLGKAVYGSDEDSGGDWADDENEYTEEQAFAGALPWIDDEDDDSNSLEKGGLRGLLTISPRLHKLFQQTFGPGRTCVWHRPRIYHWPQALAEAADSTLLCSKCKMSWYVTMEECPYCKSKKPPYLKISSFLTDENQNPGRRFWEYVHEFNPENFSLELPGRIFFPFRSDDSDSTVMEFSGDGRRFFLKIHSGENSTFALGLSGADGRFTDFFSVAELSFDNLRKGFHLQISEKQSVLLKFSVEGL